MSTATTQVYINDQQAQNALKSLSEKAAQLNDQLNEMRKANDKLGFDKVEAELKKVNAEMKSHQKTTFDVQKVLDNLSGSSYNELLKAQKQLRNEMKGMRRDTEEQNKLYSQKAKQIDMVDKELTQLQRTMRSTSTEGNTFTNTLKKIGPYLAATFSVGAVSSMLTNVINVRKEFEKYEAVLINTLGSKSEAQKSLSMIQDFASRTPFSVMELSESFVALANQGFKPTREEMTKLGDLASSTGRNFGDMAGALIAAQTGEYERLKAFGIVARTEGNKVRVTFKGVTTEIEKTGESMRNYLLSLGEMAGVSGSMGAISQTLGGKISNLGDAWEALLNTLGKLSGGIIGEVITGFASLLQITEKLVAQSPAEQMEEERLEANKLAIALTNPNLKEGERLAILTKLKTIAPDIVEGINQENINVGLLLDNLKKYNDEMANKIVLSQLDEKEMEKLDEVARKRATRLSAETNALGVMGQVNANILKENATFEDRLKATVDLLIQQGASMEEVAKKSDMYVTKAGTVIDQRSKEQQQLDELMAYMSKRNSALEDENNTMGDVEGFQERANAIRELLKVEEEVTQTITTKPKGDAVKRNKYGQTFEEWKRDQALFTQMEKEYWAQVEEIVMPREENIDDESEYLISKYKETMDGRMTFLKAYHDAGLISEAEYNDQMYKLNKERSQKEIALETMKQNAKQELVAATFDLGKTLAKEGSAAYKVIASLEAVINTYAGATAALAPPPIGLGPVAGIPLAAAVIVRGLANVARINAIQFAAGKYDVIGASDGRTYRAGMVRQAATGIYPEPTLIGGLGLVGERAPELVVDGPTLKNIQMNAPEIIQAIHAMRVPQYDTGKYTTTSAASTGSAAVSDPRMDVVISLLSELVTESKKPTRAQVVYQDIKDADDEINEIKNSVSK